MRHALCALLIRRGAAAEENSRGLGIYQRPIAAADSARAEGIRLALRELGYIEGQNIAIEYRYAEGKLDRHPELAAELVRLKVDIIVVASGDQLIRRPRMRPRRFPIVMMGHWSRSCQGRPG